MTFERQTTWGRLVALAMFFGGAGAGIYITSFILGLTSDLKLFATIGMLLGPIFVAAGLIFLLLHSTSPLHIYRIFNGLSTAWMSRGGLLQILFIILSLVYTLPAFWNSGWAYSGIGITIGIIALLLALMIASYHGIVLNEAKGIPLWSSHVAIPLSFFIALCTGFGLLSLISPAFIGLYSDLEVIKAMDILRFIGIAYIAGNFITILILMRKISGFAASNTQLKAPIIANFICLIVDLLLLSLLTYNVTDIIWSLPIAGLLLLGCGVVMRYTIIHGGYYLPLQFITVRSTQ